MAQPIQWFNLKLYAQLLKLNATNKTLRVIDAYSSACLDPLSCMQFQLKCLEAEMSTIKVHCIMHRPFPPSRARKLVEDGNKNDNVVTGKRHLYRHGSFFTRYRLGSYH